MATKCSRCGAVQKRVAAVLAAVLTTVGALAAATAQVPGDSPPVAPPEADRPQRIADLLIKSRIEAAPMLTKQGATGVATLMPTLPEIIQTVRDELQRYRTATGGRAYAVLIPGDGSIKPFATLHDDLKLAGKDLLVAATGEKWLIVSPGADRAAVAKLVESVENGEDLSDKPPPEKLAHIVTAVAAMHEPATAKPPAAAPPQAPPAAAPPPAKPTAPKPEPAAPAPQPVVAPSSTSAPTAAPLNPLLTFILGLFAGGLLVGGGVWLGGRRG